MKFGLINLSIFLFFLSSQTFSQPAIYVNQVAFDANAAKIAVIKTDEELPASTTFNLINIADGKIEFSGKLSDKFMVDEWDAGKYFYRANFIALKKNGKYKISIAIKDKQYLSNEFYIHKDALATLTIPSIIYYYNQQRANTPEELDADKKLILYGSDKTVDMHGGWCDASGDVSKYFSHLAYANFVSPQQTPLVDWSLINAAESIPKMLSKLGVKDSIEDEAIWGADYMMRALSSEDYFRMIVFSYFNKDPNARRVVGLLANSVTTSDYQCAFREGGGMAIAALARISTWKKHGDFTSAQYLDGAKRAFAHLLINNIKYDDDHKENIIDDYCALMAATELWIVTDDLLYRDVARTKANNLAKRMTAAGYFIADDSARPFWHASDAGLPVVALTRYLKKETNAAFREKAIAVIGKALDYNLRVTNGVSNPFGYARQTFSYHNKIQDGFFIPHENETGWWWQGENARLGSLATAALVGGKIAYPGDTNKKIRDSLDQFASQQLSWILGCNPYSMCFMYKFGKNNVPYMSSNFGHGSQRGGISNGITGKKENGDGSGINFKISDDGNEWRWTEQWIPHAAWFLQAVTAMAEYDQ